MRITEKRDLKIAYDTINLYKEASNRFPEKKEIIKAHIDDLKKDIRKYYKEQRTMTLVKDYGIDGYIELVALPSFIKTKEEADMYFEENNALRISPSIYDCTGRAFTGWFKTFLRRGRYMAYHSVCFDV